MTRNKLTKKHRALTIFGIAVVIWFVLIPLFLFVIHYFELETFL